MDKAQEQEVKVRAYKRLFLTSKNELNEDAKIVIYDLGRSCHMDTTTFMPGDSHASAANEGKRMVFIELLKIINFDINQYFNLKKIQKNQITQETGDYDYE